MVVDEGFGKGLVFNIQRFSIHDGPGIRTTVFLKGCPLRCPWCSNPESHACSPELLLREVKCIQCGKCQDICPEQAITVTQSGIKVNREKCSNCLKCVQACTPRALEAIGQWLTSDEVMDTVLKDASYYKRTDGGMTLSGGEPLVQWQFALSILKKAKENGLNTTLDTTGYSKWHPFEKVLQNTDLVLYDLKQLDPAKHQAVTGIPNELILENLKKTLTETSVNVWLRIPVIPQFNNSLENMSRVTSFIENLPRMPEKVSLLPFHKFAAGKYHSLGKNYEFADVPLLEDQEIEEYKAFIASQGINVDIGY
jgi:pyruvate formate lyase activating enzyme